MTRNQKESGWGGPSQKLFYFKLKYDQKSKEIWLGWAKPETVGFSIKISSRNQRNSGWGGKLETVGFSIEILLEINGNLVGVGQAGKETVGFSIEILSEIKGNLVGAGQAKNCSISN